MEENNNAPQQELKDSNPLFDYAIDEYGLVPLACVGLCIIIGAGIGGLFGIKVFIKN